MLLLAADRRVLQNIPQFAAAVHQVSHLLKLSNGLLRI
jgi:hypothetical protein